MQIHDFHLPIFEGLSEEQMHQLKPLMTLCTISEDMVIFKQGALPDSLYILVDGEVAIHYKPYDGPSLVISRIGPGNVFGWSSALNREFYSSAAIAEKNSLALRIRGDELQNLCETCPKTGAIFIDRLARVISERLKNSHHEILALLSIGMDNKSECWKRINTNGKKVRLHT